MAQPSKTTPTSSAHTEVPAKGAEPFPPFQTETFASQLFWLVVCFGFLYVMLKNVFIPRIANILSTRAQRIEADMKAAQAAKAEAEKAEAEFTASITTARTKAQDVARQTQEKLSAQSEARRKSVEADLGSKLSKAEASIQTTKANALANVEAIAVEAATEIVNRLTGKPASAASVKAAVSAIQSK